MARPRSEEKQAALLDAAATVVAAQGLGARTASIAQAADVAEGTLFRYFATKDALLNELYIHLKQSLGDAMRAWLAANAPLEDQVRSLWDGYIGWGVAHPTYVKALNQLAVSDSITAATRSKVDRLSPEIREIATRSVAQGALAERPAAFADALFMALADATIQFAMREPGQADAYKAAGFRMFWNGLTG